MIQGALFDFIVWPVFRPLLENVREGLLAQFDLVGEHRIEWPEDMFVTNLDRFYGYPIKVRDKASAKLYGPAHLFVVHDPAPRQSIKQTSLGPVLVNHNTLEFKERYRALAGGGYGLHSSVTPAETDRDLRMLCGKNLAAYRASGAEPVLRDMAGTPEWRDLAELVVLLNCYTTAVVLGQEGDRVHLLTMDAAKCRRLAGSVTPIIDGRRVRLELEEMGDGTREERWQFALLRERVADQTGVAVPRDDHLLPLALHRALGLQYDDRGWPSPLLQYLATRYQGPAIDYDDRPFCEAALNDFLCAQNFLAPRPPQGRAARIKDRIVKRLRSLAS